MERVFAKNGCLYVWAKDKEAAEASLREGQTIVLRDAITEEEKVLATPDGGWLEDWPELPVDVQTSMLKGGAE